MRCSFDALKKCIIGRYEWCTACEKYIMRAFRKEMQNKIVNDNRECIFCVIVGATPKTIITKHHVLPIAVSKKIVGKRVNTKVYICHAHHSILTQLQKPLVTLLLSSLSPEQLNGWFQEHVIPNVIKTINDFIEVHRP